MVRVTYLGRMGNRMFQYCFARILAQGLGYRLAADPIEGFSATRDRVDGEDHTGARVQLIAHDYPQGYEGDYAGVVSWRNRNLELCVLLEDRAPREVRVCGYFQRYAYYRPYKDMIRQWMSPDADGIAGADRSESDLAIHLRRGDYVGEGNALPFSYYQQVLARERFRKLFIVCEDARDPFVARFRRWRPVVISSDPHSDFCALKSFSRIAVSNSSFAWWAAFLSGAQRIYMPVPLRGNWSAYTPEIDLRVDDEPRYEYVQCTE